MARRNGRRATTQRRLGIAGAAARRKPRNIKKPGTTPQSKATVSNRANAQNATSGQTQLSAKKNTAASTQSRSERSSQKKTSQRRLGIAGAGAKSRSREAKLRAGKARFQAAKARTATAGVTPAALIKAKKNLKKTPTEPKVLSNAQANELKKSEAATKSRSREAKLKAGKARFQAAKARVETARAKAKAISQEEKARAAKANVLDELRVRSNNNDLKSTQDSLKVRKAAAVDPKPTTAGTKATVAGSETSATEPGPKKPSTRKFADVKPTELKEFLAKKKNGDVTAAAGQGPIAAGQETPVESQKPIAAGQETPVESQKPIAAGQETPVESQEPIAAGQETPLESQKPPAASPETPLKGSDSSAEKPETPSAAGPEAPKDADSTNVEPQHESQVTESQNDSERLWLKKTIDDITDQISAGEKGRLTSGKNSDKVKMLQTMSGMLGQISDDDYNQHAETVRSMTQSIVGLTRNPFSSSKPHSLNTFNSALQARGLSTRAMQLSDDLKSKLKSPELSAGKAVWTDIQSSSPKQSHSAADYREKLNAIKSEATPIEKNPTDSAEDTKSNRSRPQSP